MECVISAKLAHRVATEAIEKVEVSGAIQRFNDTYGEIVKNTLDLVFKQIATRAYAGYSSVFIEKSRYSCEQIVLNELKTLGFEVKAFENDQVEISW